MFSHMMVGSNDIERSKRFYDALFGKEAKSDEQGPPELSAARARCSWSPPPIDGEAATHGNGSTIGFVFDSPEEVDAWHAAGVAAGGTAIEDPPGIRDGSFGPAVSRLSARSRRQQALRRFTDADGVSVEIVSEAQVARRAAAGRHARVRGDRTDMTFSIFLPPQAGSGAKLPVVWYLSGLTCTHANVTEKGEYRAACAELGLIFVAPDTSPRGEDVPDARGWDFGQGAGFYVDATQEPWSTAFPHVVLRHRGAAGAGRRRISRSTWSGRRSPAIRWAGMAR